MVRLLLLLVMLLAPGARAGEPPVRIEASLSATSVLPQQQVVLTLRLWRSSALYHGYLIVPEIPDMLVEPLDASEGTRQVDGTTWRVEERRLALFPQRSGRLSIPAAAFSGRELHLRGPELSLEVQPRPPGADWWLPAAGLRLSEDWSSAAPVAGQPLERRIVAEADGVTGAQLPPLPLAPGARRIDVETATAVVDGTVVGRRAERHLIVPAASGALMLPELAVDWWDTGLAMPRRAALPARGFEVLAAAPVPVRAAAPPAPDPVREPPPLPWTAVLSALAAAVALSLVLRRAFAADRRRARRHLARVAAAARRDDARATRAALLAWGGTASLSAVAARLDDRAAAEALRRLDAAVFAAKAPPWDGADVARRVVPAVRRATRRGRGAPPPVLPDLVPQPGGGSGST